MPFPDPPQSPTPGLDGPTVFTVGDTLASLSGRITHDEGDGPQPVDGTTAVAEVHIARPSLLGSSGPVITDVVTVDADGRWSRPWRNGDLDVAGVWSVEVQLTFAGGGRQTFGASDFTVKDQLA